MKYNEVYLKSYETCADVLRQLSRFIEEVYNIKRRHSSLGYLTPYEVGVKLKKGGMVSPKLCAFPVQPIGFQFKNRRNKKDILMNTHTKNKGSEWNVWDLHIHTPASFHWNDGTSFNKMNDTQTEDTCQKIIEKINLSEPIAFSVVDYFTFDGILKVRKLLKDNPKLLKKTIFPGIELRLEAPTDFRLNVQVIFSEDITNQKLKDFKSTLKNTWNKKKSLSNEAIIEEARKLTPDKAKKYIGDQNYKTDDDIAYQLGCKTIVITRNSFEEAVKILGKDKCLTILPYETSNGICKLNWERHPREDMYYFALADFFESRKPENIDLFLGKRTQKNERFFDNFQQAIGGKSKPVLSGSDAHKIEDYGNFPHEKKTWLKAEPTFKGLRQVIVEPQARCFIGDKPERLKIIKSKATKFISRVKIEKKQDSSFDEKWFNNEIHFNSELIAIIGNKGSGKSALTDILGLLGNSKQYDSFSFLNSKKFTEKQGSKAKHFQATLHWKNADSNQKLLNAEFNSAEMEKIKYIPQSYLEKLCNEISSQKNLFDQELKNVIFSHISYEKRLGHENLDALLKFRTEEIYQEISNFRIELKKITNSILSNRKKITKEYKEELTNKLGAKQRELEAAKQSKPQVVPQPVADDSNPNIKEEINKLEELRSEEKEIKSRIANLNKEIEDLLQKKTSLDKAITKIKILEQDVTRKIQEIKNLLESVGYTDFDFFKLHLHISRMEKESKELEEKIQKKTDQLIKIPPFPEDNLEEEKQKIQEQIKKLSEEIDEPNKKYQKYLLELEESKQLIAKIQGNQNKPDTISYLNTELSEINNIPTKITELEHKRNQIVKDIYKKIKELAEIYKEFYNPVQQFLKTKPFQDDIFKISFRVAVVDKGFKDSFCNLINRHKAGTFYGTENSEKRIKRLLDSYDFNDSEKIIQFVNKIFYLLENDCRGDKPKPNKFELQTKNSPEDLYNMIFGLEYLEPKYFLQLNEKNLEQLSPGERGTLLLIFYLMVDKDDRPLILDQPEENLDNQTIFKVLVPCIKKAKKNRQIFLVTHNPNLAVVCDAEQIIVASIDKTKDNAVHYHSGAIENSETNQKIIDILEGTKPAFQNRENKYQNLKPLS